MSERYVATDGPFVGLNVGPHAVATRDAITIPLEERREPDCVNLLGRARMVFDAIAAGRMGPDDAIDMAQYITDAVGHKVTDTPAIETLRHRCRDCAAVFAHDCAGEASAARLSWAGAVARAMQRNRYN